jgi:hypothetical protein
LAETEGPGGTDDTAAATISGAEATVAAPISGAEPTLAVPASDSGSRPSGVDATALTATPRGGSSGATTLRKVGEEIANASIKRFGTVGRTRFEVLDELARGGLGRVFRARDPRTGRVVAIKEVLHPTSDLVMRFAREALVTANLQHPSIVPVYEVGTWDGGDPFYAMKLVAGRTLDRVIAEARTIDARVALVVAGDNVLVANKTTLSLLDVNGAVVHSLPRTDAFSAAVGEPGGQKQIAVGSANGQIMLYDAGTLAPLRDMDMGTAVIAQVAFRPDGNLLAAVSDRRVAVFDPRTGHLLAQLPELPVLVAQLAWSPDGRYLAIAGAGGTVWIWNIAPDAAGSLQEFGACVSPWALDDTTLVKKPFDPETCAVLRH